ncbi:glycosyltransferase family protein [Flavobacteriaceae bacterium]|nr:glycosyltransferase family protein [Flavobacteriaceae bacterium]
MKIIAITQARTGSSRFPKKILNKINGKSLLEIHIDRIKQSTLINEIIIATTDRVRDDIIVEVAESLGVQYFRGSENDVLDRFYKSVETISPDFIVRLTSDCTLIDGQLIDEIINNAMDKNLDYYSNILSPTYPDGQDIEVFKFTTLQKAWKSAKLNSEREHVTPFIKNNSTFKSKKLFTSENHEYKENYNNVRMVVDYPEDFKVMELLIKRIGTNATWKEYAELYLSDRAINLNNIEIKRNEGYTFSIIKDK